MSPAMTVPILSRQDHQTEELWCNYGEQLEHKYRKDNQPVIQISWARGGK